MATNDASVLLLIPALGHSFRGDSTSVSRICANCHVHRHSGFQIGDRASLSVYSDFGKLRNRECSRCFVVAYGNCIRSDRCNYRLVICRGWGCLLFPSLTESWINHDYGQENRHDDEQPVVHDLRLKRIAGRMKQKVFFQAGILKRSFSELHARRLVIDFGEPEKPVIRLRQLGLPREPTSRRARAGKRAFMRKAIEKKELDLSSQMDY